MPTYQHGKQTHKGQYRGQRNRRGPDRRDQKQEIPHRHFAVRNLPHELFEYYTAQKNVDEIVSVSYSNQDEGPTIEIERDQEYDTWRWHGAPFHCAAPRLPRQISRFYYQAQRTQFIQSVEFYEDASGKPIVEVDLGDVLDEWGWGASENEKFFCWKLIGTNPGEGEAKAISFPKVESKWELTDTEPFVA